MVNARTRKAIARSTAAHARAGTATFTTLAFRLPLLFAAPSAAVTAEWTRAWTEKLAAGMEGAVEAGMAVQSLAFRTGMGAVQAEHMAAEWLEVAAAATRPGYRTVSANARRLSRRS